MALGDPSVQLVYWVAEAGGYVDIAGRPAGEPAGDNPNRVLTVLAHNGKRLGALVHDASVAEDDTLVADIASLAKDRPGERAAADRAAGGTGRGGGIATADRGGRRCS